MNQSPDAVVTCRQLTKIYQSGDRTTVAVDGLDLLIPRGECFGLLGPNGAGKTTTVEMLEGILSPTSGEIEILGMRWHGEPDALRQAIGITLQETRLQEKLTLMETVRLFRSFYSKGMEPEKALAAVSLQDRASSWVRDLSGGQKQRLALACSLIGEPLLLFLDEPTTGLDPQARRQIWGILSDLRQQGRTILLTTHYMDEAEKLCDRVAIIDQGKIIAEGSPRELIARLGGEHVIEFTLDGEPSTQPSPETFSSVDSVIRSNKERNRYVLTVAFPHLSIPSLLEKLKDTRLGLGSLTTRHVNLEDVFVTLTGRHLRDG